MKLEMRAEGGVLWAVATGRFTLESGRRTFVEMLEAVASHGVAKVLLRDDGVPQVNRGRHVSGELHGPGTRHAGPLQVPNRGAPQVVEQAPRNAGIATR